MNAFSATIIPPENGNRITNKLCVSITILEISKLTFQIDIIRLNATVSIHLRLASYELICTDPKYVNKVRALSSFNEDVFQAIYINAILRGYR